MPRDQWAQYAAFPNADATDREIGSWLRFRRTASSQRRNEMVM